MYAWQVDQIQFCAQGVQKYKTTETHLIKSLVNYVPGIFK